MQRLHDRFPPVQALIRILRALPIVSAAATAAAFGCYAGLHISSRALRALPAVPHDRLSPVQALSEAQGRSLISLLLRLLLPLEGPGTGAGAGAGAGEEGGSATAAAQYLPGALQLCGLLVGAVQSAVLP